MAWVMSSTKRGSGFDITIGAVRIARIELKGDYVLLRILTTNDVIGSIVMFPPMTTIQCDSVSDAFKEMHRLLNSPPEPPAI